MSMVDFCLFRSAEEVFLGVYIDDLLIAGPPKQTKKHLSQIQSRYDVRINEKVTEFSQSCAFLQISKSDQWEAEINFLFDANLFKSNNEIDAIIDVEHPR